MKSETISMKSKLLFPLILLSTLSMSSCSTNLTGTYVFQMGKDKGVHLKAQMVLGKNDVKDSENTLLGKNFNFTMDIQTKSQEGEGDNSYQELLTIMYTIFGDGQSVDGYYNIDTKKDSNGDKIIHFGFDVDQDLIDAIATTFNTDLSAVVITSKMTELVLFSTINSKSVNLIAPVSAKDLLLQLYWYGYDFYYEEEIPYAGKVEEHEKGTHPTKEDIEAINNSEIYKTRHPDEIFRDYHVINVGLLKY